MLADLKGCRICKDRFALTATGHEPRPIIWFRKAPRILIAGQAPGARVHNSGRPFTDPSGDRLREWMNVGEDIFYDLARVAIVPMAFCFPGYNDKGADLTPPAICASTWREKVLQSLGEIPLTLVIGGAAQKRHFNDRKTVNERVQNWQSYGPKQVPLPHPSWRNNAWLNKNKWFQDDLLPDLRTRIHKALS